MFGMRRLSGRLVLKQPRIFSISTSFYSSQRKGYDAFLVPMFPPEPGDNTFQNSESISFTDQKDCKYNAKLDILACSCQSVVQRGDNY